MGEAKLKTRTRSMLVAEVNPAELGCRIFEHVGGIHGMGRPYPNSPEKSMEAMREMDPIIHARIMAATKAVVEYFVECINNGSEPS